MQTLEYTNITHSFPQHAKGSVHRFACQDLQEEAVTSTTISSSNVCAIVMHMLDCGSNKVQANQLHVSHPLRLHPGVHVNFSEREVSLNLGKPSLTVAQLTCSVQ